MRVTNSMSIKPNINNAFNQIEEATNMKNRGGIALCKDGENEMIAFFGEQDKIKTCIYILSYILMCNFGVAGSSIADLLHDDILKNIDMMKSKKYSHTKPETNIRNEFAFKDNFEEIAELIHNDIGKEEETDCFIYGMMNGNKVCVSSSEVALNNDLYNRIIENQDTLDIMKAYCLLYRCLLSIIGNYLSMYTSLSNQDINLFFTELSMQYVSIANSNKSPFYEDLSYPSGMIQ